MRCELGNLNGNGSEHVRIAALRKDDCPERGAVDSAAVPLSFCGMG